MLRANQIEADRAFVLVIDLQQKLLPAIRHRERVVASATKLLDGGRVFALPVLATEQYPKGLGSTDPTVREAADRCGARWLEKPTFSACDEPAVKEGDRLARPDAGRRRRDRGPHLRPADRTRSDRHGLRRVRVRGTVSAREASSTTGCRWIA